MSAGYCWCEAIRIASMPRTEWAAALKTLPTACERPDCGPPKDCRSKVGTYLRMQSNMAKRREAK